MNSIQITIPSTLEDTIKSLKTKLGLRSDSEVVEIAIKKYAEQQNDTLIYSETRTTSDIMTLRDKIATKHPNLRATQELSQTRNEL